MWFIVLVSVSKRKWRLYIIWDKDDGELNEHEREQKANKHNIGERGSAASACTAIHVGIIVIFIFVCFPATHHDRRTDPKMDYEDCFSQNHWSLKNYVQEYLQLYHKAH